MKKIIAVVLGTLLVLVLAIIYMPNTGLSGFLGFAGACILVNEMRYAIPVFTRWLKRDIEIMKWEMIEREYPWGK